MKQYSTVHPLYMSFYSRSLYRDVGRNWRGVAFLYLFLLLAVCWIPIMFKMYAGISAFIRDEAPAIVGQVPVITISGGRASVEVTMPYVIKDPDDGMPLIIIDTTGKTASLKNTEAFILLTKTELMFRRNAKETRVFSLSDMGDMVINKKTVYDWLDLFRKWFVVVLYPIVLIVSYVYRLIQVLIYAAIGIVIAKGLNADLDFQSILSLAIVADTPAIILNMLYNYSEMKMPFWWLICFLISMGYLYFGIKANAEGTSDSPATV